MSFYLDSFHCLFHSVEDGQIEVRGASLPCSHSSHLSGRDQIGKRKFVHTMFVPYSIACLEWKVPCFPVKPWQLRKIFWKVFKQDAPGLFFSPGIWPCSPCWATCLVESAVNIDWLKYFSKKMQKLALSQYHLSVAAPDSIFAASGWKQTKIMPFA